MLNTLSSMDPHSSQGWQNLPNTAPKPAPHCLDGTGLYVRGLPKNVSESEVLSIFERYGRIFSIEILSHGTYVNYMSRNFRDVALKHRHTYNNTVLRVVKRIVHPYHSASVPNLKRVSSEPQPLMDHELLLTQLQSCPSFDEQVEKLKHLTLIGESDCMRAQQQICSDISKCLRRKFIVKELHVFGSMVTGLAFKGSDVDVYANIEPVEFTKDCSERQKIGLASKCFYALSSNFIKVIAIRNAKVPILKAVHAPLNVSCDINVRDPLGYWNSRLVRLYLSMHERFFDVMVVIKYWAKVNNYINTNGFSSYAICILVVSFLISLQGSDGQKLVPSVQDLQRNCDRSLPHTTVGYWFCGFDESPVRVSLPDTPQYSVMGLLKMFSSYVASLPFDTHVVSILSGELLSRTLFDEANNDGLPDVFEPYIKHAKEYPKESFLHPEHVMVIQDPFRLNHNLTARINLKLKNEFISACKMFADSAHDLHQALCVPASLTTSKKRSKQRPKTVIIDLKHPSGTEPNVFQEEFLVLSRILSKILLLNVEEVEDNLPHKKLKLDQSDNVHSNDKSLEMNRTLQCTGNMESWTGRNKARLKLGIGENPNFDEEVQISSVLSQSPSASVELKFYCHFKPVNSPPKLCLEFEDLIKKKKKNSFNGLMNSLQTNLKKWIPNFINHLKSHSDQST